MKTCPVETPETQVSLDLRYTFEARNLSKYPPLLSLVCLCFQHCQTYKWKVHLVERFFRQSWCSVVFRKQVMIISSKQNWRAVVSETGTATMGTAVDEAVWRFSHSKFSWHLTDRETISQMAEYFLELGELSAYQLGFQSWILLWTFWIGFLLINTA